MKELTVKDLYLECKKQMNLGNGDRVIMISDDDEGNGYHYVYYSFMTAEEFLKPVKYDGTIIKPTLNGFDKRVAPVDKTIVLG